MKKWSLKAKLTVLYTFFMTLLTCVSLAILFSLSNQEILTSVQSDLREQVHKGMDEIEAEEGSLDVDSDFMDLEKGIYLSLYSEGGAFLYGRLPYGYENRETLSDGILQTTQGSSGKWYVYDLKYWLEGYGNLYIRGVTSVTAAENSIRITLRMALIILPLLVVFTGILGYRFTRRTLMPVRRITETVQRIRRDEDLSRRVGLGKGNDEIYQLSETFDQMLEQLEESFGREKQFTSDVSHELRTPVTVILTQCDAILDQEELSPQQRTQIGLIRKKAQDMAQMISHLLILSRADQGRKQMAKERLDLSELTEMVVQEQQLLAEKKGSQWLAEIEPQIYASVDESFYIRMLVNLISNGISYNRPGGWVRVRMTQTETEVQGSVEDNGIGIFPEALPRIWERFYRADASRTDSSHSGLGLSMVKWIVNAHGGSIRAESSVGKGSRFLFVLPKEKNENL